MGKYTQIISGTRYKFTHTKWEKMIRATLNGTQSSTYTKRSKEENEEEEIEMPISNINN